MLLSAGQPVTTNPTTNLADASPMRNASYYSSTGVSLIGGHFAAYAALYRAQPWVYTLVRKLGTSAARLPLKIFERVSDTDRRLARDTPYGDLIRNPSRQMSPKLLWLWVFCTVELYGEALLLKLRDDNGRVRELRPMHPSNVIVRAVPPERQTVTSGEVEYAYMAYGGSNRPTLAPFAASEIVHFRGYNPDNIVRGISPCEPLRQTLLSEDAMRRAQTSLYRNGARPSVILSSPNALSEGAITRLRDQWDDIHSGVDSWAKTAVLEEGLTPHLQQLTAEELQYIAGRQLNREECCAVWDVPPPAVQILDRATFCLPAESLVTTERGPVRVAEVTSSDRVWSLVDGELRTRRVMWSGQTGFKPLLTIRTQNRTLRCTDNHPLLVRRAVQTNETPYPTRRRYRWEHAWVPATDLAVGDVIVTLAELPEHGTDVCPTRVVSARFAEFCGLLLGDGWVSPAGISIARAGTAPYMDHYRSVMREEFHQRDGVISLQEQDRMTRFSSVSASRELVALGLSGTAHTKTVPEWVFGLSPKLRAAFLRGFLDADGSVDKKGRISFSSCSETMLRQIRELCVGIGVPVTNIRCQIGSTTLPNGRLCEFAQWTFTCSDPGANRIIGSHDPRYIERLEAGVPFGAGSLTTYYAYADRTGRVPLQPPVGCGHAKVTSIDGCGDAVPVFDIEVEGSHNFVAEGVVVHNSNITEQMRSLYRETMAPRLEAHEDVLATQLAPDFATSGDQYAEWVMDDVLRGSFEARIAAKAQAIGTGQMTPAEGRAQENQPFIPGSDRLLVNAALIPLGTAVDAPPTGVDVVASPQHVKGLSAQDARTIVGRLSRAATVDEIDTAKVCAGLADDAQAEALGLIRSACARSVSVPTLRTWIAAAVATDAPDATLEEVAIT